MELHTLIKETEPVVSADHQFPFMIHIQGTVILDFAGAKRSNFQVFR